MYWLRSSFRVQKKENIEQLARLYKNVCGELEFRCESHHLEIQWTNNPFDSLLKKLDGLDESIVLRDGNIVCRLCGPSTLLAVAFQPTKISQEDFEHPEKLVLLQWADLIDKRVKSKTGRDNGFDFIYTSPTIQLQTCEELLLAIRLSKFGTHVLPIQGGFLVANTKSFCWSCVFLSDTNNTQSMALCFDKDVGFASSLSSQSTLMIEYLNERYFTPWKENGMKGSLFPNLEEEWNKGQSFSKS